MLPKLQTSQGTSLRKSASVGEWLMPGKLVVCEFFLFLQFSYIIHMQQNSCHSVRRLDQCFVVYFQNYGVHFHVLELLEMNHSVSRHRYLEAVFCFYRILLRKQDNFFLKIHKEIIHLSIILLINLIFKDIACIFAFSTFMIPFLVKTLMLTKD